MISPEQSNEVIVEVELFAQPDPYGCVSACLANVARHLLAEDIDPTDVDTELGRKSTEEVTDHQKCAWLLDRGLNLDCIYVPSSIDMDDYFKGTIDFEELLRQYADEYCEGSMNRARRWFDTDENHSYLARLAAESETRTAYNKKYGCDGLNTFRRYERPGTVDDIVRGLRAGGVILCGSDPGKESGHQEMLFSDSSEGDEIFPLMYSSGLDSGSVYGINIFDPLLGTCIDLNDLIIVSKQDIFVDTNE